MKTAAKIKTKQNSKKFYYAKFKDIEFSPIAEFKTEKERDEWVNFQDEFSRDFETTIDNCVFEREKLTDEAVIHSIVNDKTIPTEPDAFLTNVKWYFP